MELSVFFIVFFNSCKEQEFTNPWDEKSTLNQDEWAPTNFRIEKASSDTILLAWDYEDINIEGFQIDKQVNDAEWQSPFKILSSDNLNFADTDITNNVDSTFNYKIFAYAGNNKSSSILVDFIVGAPTVTTNQITNISDTSAICGGNIITDGGSAVIARGVCWSTNQNPTIIDSHSTDGIGTGIFTSSITGLTVNTAYYVRAYATNTVGTAYGSQIEFFSIEEFDYEVVFVDGGTFTMGCTSEQSDCEGDEYPTHTVTLSSFYIMTTEVTQQQWFDVMGINPSSHAGCMDCPVEKVSWEDVQEFIQKLNQKTGKMYRLPTEAEWEYAARGASLGSATLYSGSNNIDEVAWYDGNSGSTTHPVGQKKANALGIFDMTGNVYEWCSDWYGEYSSGSQNNPQGASTGASRVLRGGGWNNDPQYCHASFRSNDYPYSRYGIIGFRLALVP